MPPRRTELLKGTLDLLILRTLALEPRHGMAIADRIAQITERHVRRPPGIALPRPAPPGPGRLHPGKLAAVAGGPAHEVLRADGGRPPPARGREAAVGADRGGGRPGARVRVARQGCLPPHRHTVAIAGRRIAPRSGPGRGARRPTSRNPSNGSVRAGMDPAEAQARGPGRAGRSAERQGRDPNRAHGPRHRVRAARPPPCLADDLPDARPLRRGDPVPRRRDRREHGGLLLDPGPRAPSAARRARRLALPPRGDARGSRDPSRASPGWSTATCASACAPSTTSSRRAWCR